MWMLYSRAPLGVDLTAEVKAAAIRLPSVRMKIYSWEIVGFVLYKNDFVTAGFSQFKIYTVYVLYVLSRLHSYLLLNLFSYISANVICYDLNNKTVRFVFIKSQFGQPNNIHVITNYKHLTITDDYWLNKFLIRVIHICME